MSLGWAVAFLGWMSARGGHPTHLPDTGALPAIRPGAWAAWAQAYPAGDHDHADTGYPCRMPDGRMGRVHAVLTDGEWTLVCAVA